MTERQDPDYKPQPAVRNFLPLTWKDYRGPNLGAIHKAGIGTFQYPNELEKRAGRSQIWDCCVEEIEARKKWAEKQNNAVQDKADAAAWAITTIPAGDRVVRTFASSPGWDSPGALTPVPDMKPETLRALEEKVRTFSTGANRDKEDGKLDFEGFLSPLVVNAYGTYMNFNRSLADGSTRDSDNWQKGIPLDVYVKSGWRHFVAFWSIHRGFGAKETIVWALCGILFNVSGYLHELLKKNPELLEQSLAKETESRVAQRTAARNGQS